MDNWRKARRSMNNGNCVEVADGLMVRDSKDKKVVLTFTPVAWIKFISTYQIN